jgi:capsular exopolysaccharide synthesis family protein
MPARHTEKVEFPPDSDSDGLLAYWNILRRHKTALLAYSGLGALLGLLFSLPQTPVYRSRVSLEIQALNEDFLNRRSVEPTAPNYSADSYMQTQIRLLQSGSLVERAARKLKARGLVGDDVEPGRLIRLRRAIFPEQEDPLDQALEMAADSVSVRGSGMTRIVEVFCESTQPRIAADFANQLANEFIQSNLEVRSDLSQHTSNSLTGQLKDAKAKLEQSEALLLSKARDLGLDLAGEADNLAQGELQHLQTEVLKAQADRIYKQSRFELVKSSPGESLPDVLDDPALREYRSRLAELRRQMAELNASVTPEHPKVLRLVPQITTLQAGLKTERDNILRRIQNEYEAAARREALLKRMYLERSQSISQQGVRAIQYRIAKREVDTNRQLYDSMLQNVKEAEIAAVMQSRNARIVDAATPAHAPVKPNPPLSAALGAVLGSSIGLAITMVRVRSYNRFVTPGSLAGSLSVPQLGIIPSADVPAPWRRPRLLKSPVLDIATNGAAGSAKPQRWERTHADLAESFHFALTSILFSSRSKVLVVSSPGAREGKTLSSVNLALASTRIGRRVLLVDANIRKPQLHRVFNVAAAPGLCELLLSELPVHQHSLSGAARPTAFPSLFILPVGGVVGEVAALLFSRRMTELMVACRHEFDIVFIDTPPVLQSSEARLFARRADGTILVMRAGHTTRDAAKAALDRLTEDGSLVIGTIVNDWKALDNSAA